MLPYWSSSTKEPSPSQRETRHVSVEGESKVVRFLAESNMLLSKRTAESVELMLATRRRPMRWN